MNSSIWLVDVTLTRGQSGSESNGKEGLLKEKKIQSNLQLSDNFVMSAFAVNVIFNNLNITDIITKLELITFTSRIKAPISSWTANTIELKGFTVRLAIMFASTKLNQYFRSYFHVIIKFYRYFCYIQDIQSLNIYWTHMIAYNSSNYNVMFFSISDLKIVYDKNY